MVRSTRFGLLFEPKTYAFLIGIPGSPAAGNMIYAGKFLGFEWGSPFNFLNSSGLNSISGGGSASPGGAIAFAGAMHATDEIDYWQDGIVINYRKPAAFGSCDSAAAAAGVPSGGMYANSTTGAVTVRRT